VDGTSELGDEVFKSSVNRQACGVGGGGAIATLWRKKLSGTVAGDAGKLRRRTRRVPKRWRVGAPRGRGQHGREAHVAGQRGSGSHAEDWEVVARAEGGEDGNACGDGGRAGERHASPASLEDWEAALGGERAKGVDTAAARPEREGSWVGSSGS
jgi:hypothetical protein